MESVTLQQDPTVGSRAALSETEVVAAVLLAGLAVVNVYRAGTQAISYDEAMAYFNFLQGPFSRVLTEYSASNHVLFTILARAAIALFGASELTLRLPTVIASVVFLGTMLMLCRTLFGRGILFLVSVAAVTLNPFVLDFLSAARGYGLALAAFTVGLYQVTRAVTDDSPHPHYRWWAASIALGCSVAAQLVFLLPAVALAAMALVLTAGHRDARQNERARSFGAAAFSLTLPGSLVAVAVLVVPLSHAQRSDFHFGAKYLDEMVRSLVIASLRHQAESWPPLLTAPGERIIELLMWVVTTGVGVLIALVFWRLLVRSIQARTFSVLTGIEQFIVLGTGTLALTLISLVGGHVLLDLKYPYERTGLYFLPLVTLTMAAITFKLTTSAGRVRRFGLTLVAVLMLLGARFAMEFEVTYYYVWRFDAGSRAIFDVITQWPGRHPGVQWRVGAADVFEPALTFYRITRVEAGVASISDHWAPGDWDEDFFVVSRRADFERVLKVATPVYVHPVSGVVLLRKRP